jgi:lysozyme
MKASKRIKDFIKLKEGYSATLYQDAAGVPTIGWGHAVFGYTKAFEKGITKDMAELLFEKDIKHAETTMALYIKVPLNQNQHDALVSFTFNLGSKGFRLQNGKPSTLLTRLNAGDYVGAANAFESWVYAGGKILRGLQIRRKEEKDIFLS